MKRFFKRGSRSRAVAQATAGVLSGALIGGGLFAYGTYQTLERNIETVPFIEDQPRPVVAPEFEGALNVLVMGSDSREGANGVGIGGATPGLSDTTILLHVSKDRSFAYGVSLPRDAMVNRPSCPEKDGSAIDPGGLSQFNAAFAIGGPACTVATVEELTGIRINHFAVVDFSGFRAMVDAVGGVEMCVPAPVNDPIGKIYLDAGTYTMDGATALDYVRLRHGIGVELGDIGRMKRQQAFLSALVAKVTSSDTLTNPSKLMGVLEAGTSALTTDPGFNDLQKLGSLAKDLHAIGPERITFVTVPFELWELDPNRVVWAPEAAALWERVRTDKPLPKKFLGEAVVGEKPKKVEPRGERPSAPLPPPSTAPGEALNESAYGLCE